MKTYKVWFELGPTTFSLEIRAKDPDDLADSALYLAKKLGATFMYEYEELSS